MHDSLNASRRHYLSYILNVRRNSIALRALSSSCLVQEGGAVLASSVQGAGLTAARSARCWANFSRGRSYSIRRLIFECARLRGNLKTRFIAVLDELKALFFSCSAKSFSFSASRRFAIEVTSRYFKLCFARSVRQNKLLRKLSGQLFRQLLVALGTFLARVWKHSARRKLVLLRKIRLMRRKFKRGLFR